MNMGDPYDVPFVHAAEDALSAALEALRRIRDIAKWYGEGPRLEHEVHHALVVEVHAIADEALNQSAAIDGEGRG